MLALMHTSMLSLTVTQRKVLAVWRVCLHSLSLDSPLAPHGRRQMLQKRGRSALYWPASVVRRAYVLSPKPGLQYWLFTPSRLGMGAALGSMLLSFA